MQIELKQLLKVELKSTSWGFKTVNVFNFYPGLNGKMAVKFYNVCHVDVYVVIVPGHVIVQ